MARREEEEDWIDEVKQREEFVVDENLHDFDVYGDEVTYRRAPDLGATAFVAARFDALDEELYHPMMMKSDNKTPAFTTETAFAPAPPVVEVKGSPDLEPSGPVPEASIVAYHEVNPMFESDAHANDIFRKLKASIRPYVEEYVCYPDWTIDAFAMVAAEEVHFNVQLHHVPEKNVIRVDFNLREGDDYQFLEIVDKIRKDCRDLDRELAQLPEFSFDLFSSWSSSGELFPGSLTVDEEDLLLLLDDITSEHSHPFTRFEAAKQLKDYCQYTANRETLRRSHHLIAALEKMLQDDNEDIVRFAIYAILNFAQDPASWSGMNFPALPEILQTIEQNVHKRSTKKLASDLHSTILSHPSGIAVGGKQ